MGISALLDEPFYLGTAAGTTSVPGKYDVAINGRGYFLNTKHDAFNEGIKTVPVLRNQADTGDATGEQSLNPEGLWRRSLKSWHHGAGQMYWDRNNSDPFRFRSSKGIDPWTPWNLKAHLATTPATDLDGSSVMLCTAGEYLYMSGGSDLSFVTDVTTAFSPSDVTMADSNVYSITSDGANVWTAHGAEGIYLTSVGDASATQSITGSVTGVGYFKGRLMATYQNSVYNPTAPGALPAALFTHPNTAWRWVGFADGPAFIYMAGNSGDKSAVYKVSIKSDGTALDPATFVVAGELPDGETINCILGVNGIGLLIGTDEGVRFALFDDNQNLSIQPLINIGTPVYSFADYRNFVYFGWGPYDTANSGIGRLDLSTFVDGVPAYASDLMDDGAIVGGVTTSVVMFQGKPVFGVSDATTNTVYVPDTDYVASGQLDSGLITYDLSDPKLGMYLDLVHDALPADTSVRLDIASDGGLFASVGLSNVTDSTGLSPVVVGELTGERFEVRTIIYSDTDETPVVTRQTLRSYPTPSRARVILVPLMIHERVISASGGEYYYEPLDEFEYFNDLLTNRRLSTYQELSAPFSVFIEDFQLERTSATKNRSFWNHTLVLKLKVLPD